MTREIEIPAGYEAKIEGNKVIIELKESKDERIRKRIRLCLDECMNSDIIRDYERDECFAYLEKQKDEAQRQFNLGMQAGREEAMYEVEKEQKPIFKKGDKVIWQDEEFNILDVNGDSYNVGGYILPFYRQNELSLVRQKPAEWSEEDKYILEDAITAIDMHLTDEFKEIHPNLFKAFLEAKDFLKSLRHKPHWKPSKEQMRALAWWKNYSDNLESLYNDLKKLM